MEFEINDKRDCTEVKYSSSTQLTAIFWGPERRENARLFVFNKLSPCECVKKMYKEIEKDVRDESRQKKDGYPNGKRY